MYATSEDEVIGHAIGVKFHCESLGGNVSWITQLVVNSKYRNQSIGCRLCQLACDNQDVIACGLASCHPYAVKAVERATKSLVDVDKVIAFGDEILLLSGVSYLATAQTCFHEGRCVANTSYFVSHEEVNEVRSRLRDWRLGHIDDGEEFVAICFPHHR